MVKVTNNILTTIVSMVIPTMESSTTIIIILTSNTSQVKTFVKDGTILMRNVKNINVATGMTNFMIVGLKLLIIQPVLILMRIMNMQTSGMLPIVKTVNI